MLAAVPQSRLWAQGYAFPLRLTLRYSVYFADENSGEIVVVLFLRSAFDSQ